MEKKKTRKIEKWDEVKGAYSTDVKESGETDTPEEVAGAGPSISRNPMRSIEDMVEQNDNSFDGVINNVATEPIVVTLVKTDEDKKSVREKLKEQRDMQCLMIPEKKPTPAYYFERELMGW